MTAVERLPIGLGTTIKYNHHIWRVERVDGNYVHISHGGRRKVIPLETAEAARDFKADAREPKKRGPARPLDNVAQGLLKCKTVADLTAVAFADFGLALNPKQTDTLNRLPNPGVCRMYVLNAIRHHLKKSAVQS